MKVYIGGPMTGIEKYNFDAFNRAQAVWRVHGHDEVITPFDTNSVVWQKHHGTPFIHGVSKCDYGDPLLTEMFAADIAALAASDVVALLEGWGGSSGARTEIVVGLLLGKVFYDADDPNCTTPLVFHLKDILATVKRDVAPSAPESVLTEAHRLVHGNRGADYGHPFYDYRTTGRLWGAMIERWLHTDGYVILPKCATDGADGERFPDLPAKLAALMMANMKISRELHKPKRDNLTDLAGYTECAHMIEERQK